MADPQYDYTTFDPTILSDAAADLGSAAADVIQSPSSGGVPGPSSSGTGASPDAGQSIVDTTVSALLATVPGAGDVLKLIGMLKSVIEAAGPDIKIIASEDIHSYLRQLTIGLHWGEKVGKFITGRGWQEFADLTTGTLFTEMLQFGLGLDRGELEKDAGDALKTVDRMLAFALIMQSFGIAAGIVGKGILGGRFAESVSELIGKITEDMGLSWALGITIEESFKAAQGVVLEEAINYQKRPNRIGWPQLRTLFQRHIIDDEGVLKELLRKQGFPEDQIRWIMKLQDVQLPIGDIQQLWYRDAIDGGEALNYIGALGFNEKDAGLLYDLYVEKSDNEATATYRSIARGMFTDHLIAEDQYRKILEDGNYPKKLIEGDITAIRLEQQVGRVLNTVSTIKQEYQHGIIDDKLAKSKLTDLNYAPEYIAELVTLWSQVPLHPRHGLSQAKVLSYYISGLIKRDDAKSQLLSLNLDPATVDFLLDHPSANEGVKVHKRTPSLVTQAYIDGVVTDDTLKDALTSAGVAADDMSYYVGIAQYRKANRRRTKNGRLELDASQIRAAFKVGLIDFPTCVARLEALGYTDDAAMTLTEITNKGPYQPSGPAPFHNLGEAIAFLESLGYTLTAPPDPRIAEAETMVEMAGYIVNPPTQSGIPGGRGSGGNQSGGVNLPPLGEPGSGLQGGGTGEPPVIINPPIE